MYAVHVVGNHGWKFLMTAITRNIAAKSMAEKELQKNIRDLAKVMGWDFVYSIPDSRMATARGMPDLLMLKEKRLLFAELKTQSGKLRLEQRQVLYLLEIIEGVEVHVWRPSDWLDGTIERILK